ncbi:YncE family protein [Bacteroides ihuae]|uniref:YncE family protein n=1 Tax=Bacteroides ihuae TaxID=1852362 RepID=UPI000B00F436|nr:YncE family protein [Bacteroides ihuae]
MFNVYKIFFFSLIFLVSGCMNYGPITEEDFNTSGDSIKEDSIISDTITGKGLFITNEGNFTYGNASLSYYDTETKKIEREVFARSNAQKLGDVAQSMTIHKGIGWIVVNNSGVIFAININTFKEVGRITGFTSPRYIHFLSDEKAYVTQIWDRRICIVNPKTYKITGYIDTPMKVGSESTEQMVQYGKYVFTNCWSYNNKILVIDTETDQVYNSIEVGIQPTSLVIDKNNKIWTVTDGGYKGSPYGYETPSLYRIDAATQKVEKQFRFKLGEHPSEVQLNGTRDTLYFINNDIWRLPVTAERFPVKSFIPNKNTIYYGLTVNPINSEIYIADAIDYVQSGVILRYSSDGVQTDEFKVGIIPGAFCWR